MRNLKFSFFFPLLFFFVMQSLETSSIDDLLKLSSLSLKDTSIVIPRNAINQVPCHQISKYDELLKILPELCNAIWKDLGKRQPESCYQNVLVEELKRRECKVEKEISIPIVYGEN